MPIYFTGGSFNGGTITNPLVIAQGTITANAPQISGTVDWNNSGVAFTGWLLNATSTASAADSRLLTLQLGGNDKLWARKDGSLLFTGGMQTNWVSASSLGVDIGYTDGAISLPSTWFIGWSSSPTNTVLPNDVRLYRDATGTLTQRNGTAAQRGDIDNTWTSATVKEGFKVDWITTANVCEIGVFKGSGGGTARQADWMSPDGIVALRFQMGFSTGRAPNLGTANVNTTAVGNVDAGEDVLMTYDLPLASFIAATKRVHITAWGNTANNVNAKTLKLYFGSVILTNSLATSIAGTWRIEADVVSTGTDAQDYVSQLVTTGAAGVALNDIEQGTLTEDDGAAITIKCTGEGVATNDIIQQGMIIVFGN